MTTLVERAEATTRKDTLRTLAGVEARRYARHPLFLIGVALLVYVMVLASDELDATGDATIAPAFFLGVLGVFVGHRLTRSMARSSEAVESSPADRVTRTAALCLACLVPGAVAVVWVASLYVAMAVWPFPGSAAISTTHLLAVSCAGVVFAVGGPLLGVMIGRWTRFPGAALLTAVLLYASVVLGSFGMSMPASRLGNLIRLTPPYTLWTSAEGADHHDRLLAGGSPGWYLVYITMLCGLAATAAMLHKASGPQRSRLIRTLVALALLAAGSLGMAAMADPTRIPL